ncbi:hypothetical protein [Viscerimonas tarda]
MRAIKILLKVLAFLAVLAAAVAVVMLLWNALIPSIVGWSAITYWQSAGLLVLLRLLFGGFGHFGKMGHFWHHHGNHHQMHELKAQMEGMSHSEKREFIRNHMRKHHPFFGEQEQTTAP